VSQANVIDPDLLAYALQQASQIQQIPAPTLDEVERGLYLRAEFERLGLTDVHFDDVGNLLGKISGASGRSIVLAAHMDTVFPKNQSLTLIRQGDRLIGPGIGDNALGLAALLTAAKALGRGASTPGDIWLVATVGEEGAGNLAGMRQIVRTFGAAPLAYIILEGIGLGRVIHQALAIARYRLRVQTPGGHPWSARGTPSAIHVLIQLGHEILRIPMPASPRCTVNIGLIQGGVSVNTCAPEAWMEIDVRSESAEGLEGVIARLRQVVGRVRDQIHDARVRIELEAMGHRPAGEIPFDHPLVKAARECLLQLGITPISDRASTDANVPLSQGYPAICLGIASGGRAHTPEEYIETSSVALGLRQVLCLLERLWGTSYKSTES